MSGRTFAQLDQLHASALERCEKYALKLEAYESAMLRARGAMLDGIADEATDGERLSALMKAHRILAEVVR